MNCSSVNLVPMLYLVPAVGAARMGMTSFWPKKLTDMSGFLISWKVFSLRWILAKEL